MKAIFDCRAVQIAQTQQLAFDAQGFRHEQSVARFSREPQRRINFFERVINAANGTQSGGTPNLKKRIVKLIACVAQSGEATLKQVDPAIGIASLYREATLRTKPESNEWA